ncbi:MAG: hypothetical protein ACTS9Y_01220 [Methylophilus sp.]|uniref:hypothetical protein n=1 Tax=Methylophilus sp. TaxID=29541 RepID=UPI003FA1595D
MNLQYLIVDCSLSERVGTYNRIDNFIVSYGVRTKNDAGFVKDRLKAIFSEFRVKVVPIENVRAEPNAKLTFPVLDRHSRNRYQVYVGDVNDQKVDSQIALI